ncbi:MAG: RluA family pseudouridine synthase [Candidatus Cloacimonetes bacterium]|nr:RluA family pseudouridine synthase [Candidatus Cloacimonadota bacterium]MCF7813346.1 RluA family pseudouridine synthase [Candidatus Cloacimonadota bacterium]MCF7867835.1 RluA family pseudouridine synthase [Candidatus Cloacimonadota bacterium]MCF7883279.1 RluA family pseudouridine synthase [Candidatus Cloacimonadota bacterium]
MVKELIAQHIVPSDVTEVRFIDYARQVFTQIPSRNGIRKAIKSGEITIDGKPAEYGRWMQPQMVLELWKGDEKPVKIFPLKFDVIFEDEFLAVIYKPAGFPVSGNRFKTIENAILNNISVSQKSDALINPKPVHRLDALTSGLLIIAKTTKTRIELGKQFEEKNIRKRYRAIAMGKLPESGKITEPIEGKEAITNFKLIKAVPSLKSEWLSLVDLWPQTGRTHQLRIHLSGIGCPILGDKLYGEKNHIFKGKGLFLSAVELNFTHPIIKEKLELKIEEPNKFKIHLEREEERWKKFNK